MFGMCVRSQLLAEASHACPLVCSIFDDDDVDDVVGDNGDGDNVDGGADDDGDG